MLKGERVEDHFATHTRVVVFPPCAVLFALPCALGLLNDPAPSCRGLPGLPLLLFSGDPLLEERTREREGERKREKGDR